MLIYINTHASVKVSKATFGLFIRFIFILLIHRMLKSTIILSIVLPAFNPIAFVFLRKIKSPEKRQTKQKIA